ncbi:MAG TPA: glycosyltransferase [archaeon]|nr:glycosyltransferase [archaeon]
MKIAMFTDAYRPQINGVVTSIENFSTELRKMGHDVVIFAPKSVQNTKDDLYTYRFSSVPFRAYKEYRIAVPYQIVTDTKIPKDFDIVHVHSPFSLGFLGLRFAKHYGIPSVGSFHTLFPEYPHYAVGRLSRLKEIRHAFRRVTWTYLSRFYNQCSAVISPSETMTKEITLHGIKNIFTVPNGVKQRKIYGSKKSIRKSYGFANDDKIMLHVGRITKEKNIDFIIKTLSESLKNNANYKLIIASDGPYRKSIEELAEKLNLKGNVIFTGYLDDKKLEDYYSLADVFLMASRSETQGLVLVEAAMAMLPSVVLDAPVIGDFVKENGTGIAAKEADFATAVDAMIKQKPRNIEKKCIAAAKKYEIQRCARQLLKVYESVRR